VSTGEIDDLTRQSSFVFSGTVQEAAASNVPLVEPTDSTLLVRIDRGLRTNPALGDVRGRLVTVETATPDELTPGTQAVFFADSLVHGDELAVRERAHIDAGRADEVAGAVARLPDVHLMDRLRDAAAVVHAQVTSTASVPGLPLERRAPWWAEATLDILETLKGDPTGKRLFFPTSNSHHWYLAPRLTLGQRGVFLLHVDDPNARDWLDDPALAGAVTALDPADDQPDSELGHVKSLLEGLGTT
jgi:hypothetical protein